MNKLLLSAIVSLVVSLPSIAESSVTKHHHGKSGAELATACEEHMNKVKDTGDSLSPEWKAEFDYNLKLVAIEIEAMRDLNHKDSHKHSAACHRHLKAAERYVEKNLKKEERAKKAEERKVKAEVDHGKAEPEVAS